jgi:hypothetical protein
MGQLIGTALQLTIGQLVGIKSHGRSFRILVTLPLN